MSGDFIHDFFIPNFHLFVLLLNKVISTYPTTIMYGFILGVLMFITLRFFSRAIPRPLMAVFYAFIVFCINKLITITCTSIYFAFCSTEKITETFSPVLFIPMVIGAFLSFTLARLFSPLLKQIHS